MRFGHFGGAGVCDGPPPGPGSSVNNIRVFTMASQRALEAGAYLASPPPYSPRDRKEARAGAEAAGQQDLRSWLPTVCLLLLVLLAGFLLGMSFERAVSKPGI